MAESIDKLLLDQKPSLVVWQTGTYDAVRGTDPEEFRAAVSDGVEKLQAGGADVVLVNMQYSPRTESIVAIGAYADGMRWVSREREVPVFDRLAIMRHWYDAGQFDLYKRDQRHEDGQERARLSWPGARLHDHRRGASGSTARGGAAMKAVSAFFSIERQRWLSPLRRQRRRSCRLARKHPAVRTLPPKRELQRARRSRPARLIRSSAWRSGSPAASRSRSSPSARHRPPAPAQARPR